MVYHKRKKEKPVPTEELKRGNSHFKQPIGKQIPGNIFRINNSYKGSGKSFSVKKIQNEYRKELLLVTELLSASWQSDVSWRCHSLMHCYGPFYSILGQHHYPITTEYGISSHHVSILISGQIEPIHSYQLVSPHRSKDVTELSS